MATLDRSWHGLGGWRSFLWLLILISGVLLTGCQKPGYFIDIFPEMHYQPSYRPQEPPRLYPPSESVPVGGREMSYSFDQAALLQNPFPRTPQTAERANRLYSVDCAVCHGADGRGKSVVGAFFQTAGAKAPADLASAQVQGRSDGQLYWALTNGFGFMPPFGKLLTEEERWLLVHSIRSFSP